VEVSAPSDPKSRLTGSRSTRPVVIVPQRFGASAHGNLCEVHRSYARSRRGYRERVNRLGVVAIWAAIVASAFAVAARAADLPHPRWARPDDPIAIQTVVLSEHDMRAGDTVTGIVITTVNVAAVTAQAGGYRVSLPKVAPGTFRTSVQVPRLWDWDWRGDVTITAIRTDGATVEAAIPVEIRW
jgi:hypothetical protein